jgi:hypothetical protein
MGSLLYPAEQPDRSANLGQAARQPPSAVRRGWSRVGVSHAERQFGRVPTAVLPANAPAFMSGDTRTYDES